MNDALIIQHVSENSAHVNLLRATASRNMEYCLRHKMDIEMLVSGPTPLKGDWDKVKLIRSAMELPYKYIIYLDADTVITDMGHDLRQGVPNGKIGCVRHVLTSPPYNVNLDHLNVGVMLIDNCEATKAFVDKWLAGYPGTPEPAWWEQGVLNDINDGTVVEISARYNSTGNVNPCPDPVIIGFHGQGDVAQRFNAMLLTIGKR